MKKISVISFATIILLLLSVMLNVFVVSASNQETEDCVISKEGVLPFIDVKTNHWYYDALVFCYANNIIHGMDEYSFQPNGTLTRAQFVTMLANIDGIDKDEYTVTDFTDVKETHWYYSAVAWAYQNGYIHGVGNGRFSPNSNLTREQMAVIFTAYMVDKEYVVLVNSDDLNRFADTNKISSWAKDGMNYAVSSGLIVGTTDNTLSPRNNFTRAQATIVMMKFMRDYYYGESCLHDNTLVATCTQPETCECGMKFGLALGHRCENLSCINSSICNVCGEYVSLISGLCDIMPATCTVPKFCRVCNTTYGKANGHNYSNATCTAPKECKVCGVTTGSALGHNIVGTTCTKNGKCTRCGLTQTAYGHSYTKVTCIKSGTCTRCGSVKSALGHEYVKNYLDNDRSCKRCGKPEPDGTEPDWVNNPQTDEEKALVANFTCEDCDNDRLQLGLNGSCVSFIVDKNCPNCGIWVKSNTCHTCDMKLVEKYQK